LDTSADPGPVLGPCRVPAPGGRRRGLTGVGDGKRSTQTMHAVPHWFRRRLIRWLGETRPGDRGRTAPVRPILHRLADPNLPGSYRPVDVMTLLGMLPGQAAGANGGSVPPRPARTGAAPNGPAQGSAAPGGSAQDGVRTSAPKPADTAPGGAQGGASQGVA